MYKNSSRILSGVRIHHNISLTRHHFVSTFAKPKILVIGAGWAGYRVALDLDKSKFEVSVVSPRNHFLFTPLLPSTAVGTLEFRAIQEPVRTIPHIKYFQASVETIDYSNKIVNCVDEFKNHEKYSLHYDGIVIAPGSENNTFGVKGVENNPNVFFLKQLQHSRSIRNRLLECFEMASSPKSNPEDIKKLLSFVVVGGGPTSIEFAAELYDFIKSDVSRWYPDLYRYVHVTVVEASGHILSSFSESLVTYVEKLFTSRRVQLITGTSVKEVQNNTAILSNGKSIEFGLMVWSTGVKQTKMIENMSVTTVEKSRNGRLLIDSHLRILTRSNMDDKKSLQPIGDGMAFALGDCACDSVVPLPQLAQVASQQGIYIAKYLNKYGLEGAREGQGSPFKYHHLGSLASIGQWKGVYDSSNIDINDTKFENIPPLRGFLAFLLWRTAYWTRQVSITNKLLIVMYWFKSAVFGRDISRF